jgi:4-amino-4-deoxy-L-arabinose transferase-like glycosyltransferase
MASRSGASEGQRAAKAPRPSVAVTELSPAAAWPAWAHFAAIAGLAAVMFGIRLAAPPNLLEQDQERPATYVLDAIINGNWLVQSDPWGGVTAKPPVWTWLSALVALAQGHVSLFSLYLPGALAALCTALLVLAVGRLSFGVHAGFVAAVASVLHIAGFKAIGLARTDAVFTCTVVLTALLAFRSWMTGGGWTWFWLAAALSTLTKGPLGLVFAACGLLACAWERASGVPAPLRGSHKLGVALFVALTVGWFALSVWALGQPVVDRIVMRELIGNTVGHKTHIPQPWLPSWHFVIRVAPWSLLTVYGLWRIWTRPDSDPTTRRFERFLLCWFVAGMLILSIAPHQRADLMLPLVPAAALIAGREAMRLTEGWDKRASRAVLATLVIVIVAAHVIAYFAINPGTPYVRQTVAVRELAERFASLAGPEFPLTHTDDPLGLQVYLNVFRPTVSLQRAHDLLRGPAAAFVAVNDFAALDALRRPGDPPLSTVLEPRLDAGLPTRIVSNRPTLEASESMAFAYGGLSVRLEAVRLTSAAEGALHAHATREEWSVVVKNEKAQPRPFRVVVSHRTQPPLSRRTTIGGHESWTVSRNR